LREGVDPERIRFVGNTMIDTLLQFLPQAEERPDLPGVELPDEYAVLTIHRPSNLDDSSRLKSVVAALHECAEGLPIVAPLHPRTVPLFSVEGFLNHPKCLVASPLKYLDFVALLRNAKIVITDSGGVQEETTMLGVPCLTLRPNTERPETVKNGTNRLVNVRSLPREFFRRLDERGTASQRRKPKLWDGQAGARAATVIEFALRRTL